MSNQAVRVPVLITAVLLSISAIARADCETDMAQLDEVLKSPSLSADGKKGLLDAKKKAIAAVKTDDDATCNKVIVAAIKQAGVARTAQVASAPTTSAAAAMPGSRLGDLAPFRSLTSATLRLVKLGDLPNARMSIKDLETAWDQAEPRLRPRNADIWKTVDQAIDRALSALRASQPDATASAQALTNLLAAIDTAK